MPLFGQNLFDQDVGEWNCLDNVSVCRCDTVLTQLAC